VIVTYYPEVNTLRALLLAIGSQADTVLIVDNTPSGRNQLQECTCDLPVNVLRMGGNCGVAAAHNAGARWAREHGHSHVLLLDQDSMPAPDMLDRLLAAERALKLRGVSVAALAPLFFDPRYGRPAPFIVRRGWRIVKLTCGKNGREYHRIEYAISSGTLIALDVLEAVGEMDAGLFIDYVDIEWGLRAQSKGYASYGICAAHMRHQLGDRTVTLPGVGAVPVRSPLRHYYHFRNAVHLYQRPYVPMYWKLNDAYRLALKYVFYATLTPPRWQHLKMMTLGLWHGLSGRLGPCPAVVSD
jgi:rhamnosyltransferase